MFTEVFQMLHQSSQSLDLRKLSSPLLIERMDRIVATERKISRAVIETIAEVSRRRAYLGLGYPSLFDYLTKHCGYENASAMRRIEAARLLEQVPEVAQKITDGKINLSQMAKVQWAAKISEKTQGQAITPEKKKELLEKIEGQSCQKTESILGQALQIDFKPEAKTVQHHDGSKTEFLTLTEAESALVQQCLELNSHALPNLNLKELLLYLVEKNLKSKLGVVKKDGRAKAQDKTKTQNSAAARTRAQTDDLSQIHGQDQSAVQTQNKGQTHLKDQSSCKSQKEKPRSPSVAEGSPRHAAQRRPIKISIRRKVFARDKCCQFVDQTTGQKCESRIFLEIDHLTPVWAGGDDEFENLQLLCGAHNRFRYRQQCRTEFK